jgi:hypothetical protein
MPWTVVRASRARMRTFRDLKRVRTRETARWLACALPCRRFAVTLAGASARLGAEVGRYAFRVVAPPTPCRSPGALRLSSSKYS